MEMKRVKRKNHGRSGLSRGVWERRRQPRRDSGDDCSPANDKDRLHQVNPEQPPRNPCRPQRHDHRHKLPEEKMLATNHDQTSGKKIRPALTTRDVATTLKLIPPLPYYRYLIRFQVERKRFRRTLTGLRSRFALPHQKVSERGPQNHGRSGAARRRPTPAHRSRRRRS